MMEADLRQQMQALVKLIKQDLSVPGCLLITLTFQMVTEISNSGYIEAASIALTEASRLANAMQLDIKKFQDYYNEYSILKLEMYALDRSTDNSTVN